MHKDGTAMEGITGEIRILRKLNKYEFAVEIRVMREGINNNRWDYRNLRKHYLSFLGQPILIAYVGKKIGDGHNMRTEIMPDGGVEYTFIDGTAERIIGTLSDREEDFRLEEADGNLWMIAKGRIFRFYAKEAVEKLIVTGTMSVSAETEVMKTEYGADGVEIFTDWAGLGVTILGDDVPPAIPGARIKAMSLRDDLEGMMIRAASMKAAEDGGEDEPDDADDEDDGKEPDESPRDNNEKKGVKHHMNKRELALLQKQFSGYTVLNASDDGLRVCLASEDTGAPCGYVFRDDEDKNHFFPERVSPMRVNATFAFDEGNELSVDVEQITDSISAKLISANAAIQEKDKKIAELTAKVADMEAMEKSRRVSDAKKAVMNRLDMLNRNRDERCAYSKTLADEVCARCESGCFNECMEDGKWCGDSVAVKELEAKCAQEQEKMDSENAEKAKKAVSWNAFAGMGDKKDADGIDALLAFATK
jgi:hypothetical protein